MQLRRQCIIFSQQVGTAWMTSTNGLHSVLQPALVYRSMTSQHASAAGAQSAYRRSAAWTAAPRARASEDADRDRRLGVSDSDLEGVALKVRTLTGRDSDLEGTAVRDIALPAEQRQNRSKT